MKYLVIITFTILFAGCFTPKKAVDVLSRPKNEPTAAAFCSQKYPVRDSIIKGDSVVRFDTLWGLVTDTLISEPQVIIETKYVPKTVTKTITVRDTIVRENTAKVSVLNSQIAKLEADKTALEVKLSAANERGDNFKSKYHKTISWLILCVVILGVWVYLKVRKIL